MFELETATGCVCGWAVFETVADVGFTVEATTDDVVQSLLCRYGSLNERV